MTKLQDRHSVSLEELTQQMSEVISLREKVAQAELAASVHGPVAAQRREAAKSKGKARAEYHRRSMPLANARAGHCHAPIEARLVPGRSTD